MMNWDNSRVTVTLDDIISSGVDIWDFDYPVPRQTIEYNGKTAQVPWNKSTFQQKILDHYRFRQIGQETVGRWLHYFRTRIREIMPYYIQLYEFDAVFHNIEDPLESYTLTETLDRTGKGSTQTQDSGNGYSIHSDTPGGRIENLDDGYMSDASKQHTDSSGTASSDTSENYTMTRRGNIGVQPLGGEVENIRHAFINIDKMVIDELKDLFLLIY